MKFSNRLLSSGYLGIRAALSWPSVPFLALRYWNRMPNESNELWHTIPFRLNQTKKKKKLREGLLAMFNLIGWFDSQECTSRFPRSNECGVLGTVETAYNLYVISLCKNRKFLVLKLALKAVEYAFLFLCSFFLSYTLNLRRTHRFQLLSTPAVQSNVWRSVLLFGPVVLWKNWSTFPETFVTSWQSTWCRTSRLQSERVFSCSIKDTSCNRCNSQWILRFLVTTGNVRRM